MPFTDEDIPVAKLVLDPGNPRHPFQESQREIYQWMTQGRGRIGDKLANLAKSIVAQGLNPAERLMVTADSKKPDEYIALEGNRRLAAVKFLNDPSKAPTKEWQERFKKLQGPDFASIKKLRCTVFDSPEEAYPFLELKHLGQAGGAGVVPWDTEQKARHALRVKQQSRHHKAIDVVDYVKSHGQDGEARRHATSGVPITTLDRVLNDPDFRQFLGLGLSGGGQIAFSVPAEEALPRIERVVKDLGSRAVKVGAVMNKKKREGYMHRIAKSQPIDYTKTLKTEVPLREAMGLPVSAVKKGKGGSAYQDPRKRRTVVLPGSLIPIDAKRFNRARRVFEELRRLPLRDKERAPEYANAAILLVRLFIEMSINIYIAEKSLKHPSPTGWKDISLEHRMRAVLGDLTSNSRLDHAAARVITKVLGTTAKLAHPNSLNDYAHNDLQVPHPADIIDIWDTYNTFLQALWSALHSTK